MADDKQVKKRPRDILASLDAAFAPSKAKPASKYTAQAALQANAAVTQQAYQHSKHKKKKANQAKAASAQPTHATSSHRRAHADSQLREGAQNGSNPQPQATKEPYDALYGRLDVGMLQVGLKNCSLHAKAASMRKANTLNATLKQYIDALTTSHASDKLKNKVLQFDNPIRTTAASKRVANEAQAQAQSAKLLSARQRRKLGMHMMASAVEYSEAEKLCEIWRRYARDVIGSDFVGNRSDQAARTARLQAKLRTIDLSGCPIEVVKARNPLNVGTVGIIVADKTQVVQVCVAHSSTVLTLPKRELRFRVTLDDQRAFFMDGQWLLDRRNNE